MSATLKTLVSFNGANGAVPVAGLIADSNGDLFGTTHGGGANDDNGTVFEIAKTSGGYASSPTTLVSFDSSDGAFPNGGLTADSNGDLLGTTAFGGANDDGTVFEVAKTAGGYASTPTTLVSFNGTNGENPEASLIADSNGDLFGITLNGGENDDGTVFEIATTSGGYASAPTTLVTFNGADGLNPGGSPLADANGDLFGTTAGGGANNDGTVFEIKKTAAGYANAPTTLISFNGADGLNPDGSLVADSNGDLFGTTANGGAGGKGTVFEIVKTQTGYASAPTTLVSFNGADGSVPQRSVIADANGDLFGTTFEGGDANDGTVFEIKKTAAGYASAPTTLVNFNGDNGEAPVASLLADANGDLFSTTTDGANGQGTVFEITGGGFLTTPPPPPPTGAHDILFQNASGQVAGWEVDGASLTGSALLGANPGPNWSAVGTGDFNGDSEPDILLHNTNGNVAVWETDGTNVTTAAVANPGASWKAVGTGDFDGDHHSDILLQNTNGNVAIWEMSGTDLTRSAVVTNPGANWKAVATGAFDDPSDIVLQNTNGSVAIWDMGGTNGTHVMSSAVVTNPGVNWKVIGTGDFNGDGDSDILLQNTSGAVAIWEMSGAHLMSSAVVANPGPSWHAIGTDGGADILLQNTSGQTAIWDMSGTSVTASGTVSANAGPNWHAIGMS